MVTLRIFLMGLVALVPHYRDGGMSILMQDAWCGPHKHIPVLIYEKESRDCQVRGCEVGDGNLIGDLLGRGGAASPGILLRGHEIEVLGVDQRANKPFDLKRLTRARGVNGHILGQIPRTRTDQFDLSWLTRMNEIAPSSATVRSDVLGPAATGLAGRLNLAAGALRIVSFADVQQKIRSMTFRPLGDAFKFWGTKQAVVDVAVITLRVRSDNNIVTIRLIPFKGSSGVAQDLKLKAHGGVIDVLLGNLSPLSNGTDIEAPAEHFAMFTKMSGDPKKETDMPIPHLGWSGLARDRVEVEDDQVPVIRAVSRYTNKQDDSLVIKTFEKGKGGGGQGGSNRPICTLAVMTAPEEAVSLQSEPMQEVMPDNVRVDPELFDILAVARNIFLRRAGVSGVDIGCQETGNSLAVRVHVTDESMKTDILKELGEVVKGKFPVRVLVARYVAQQGAGGSGAIKSGLSISLASKTAPEGTLGLIVSSDGDGKAAFISAGHVLNTMDETVVQPSVDKGGKVVGKVKLIDKAEDAALVGIKNGVHYDETDIRGVRFAKVGDIVSKDDSASTEAATGKVCGRGFYNVVMEHGTETIKGFQIIPEYQSSDELTAPGDSGAFWYIENGKIGVGLNIAGEESASEPEYAIASDLCCILTNLKVPPKGSWRMNCEDVKCGQ